MIVQVQGVNTEWNWLFYLAIFATEMFGIFCNFSVSEHLNIACYRGWSHHGRLMSMGAKPSKTTWKVPLAGSQGALSCTPTCVTVLTNEYKSWEQHTRARSELTSTLRVFETQNVPKCRVVHPLLENLIWVYTAVKTRRITILMKVQQQCHPTENDHIFLGCGFNFSEFMKSVIFCNEMVFAFFKP